MLSTVMKFVAACTGSSAGLARGECGRRRWCFAASAMMSSRRRSVVPAVAQDEPPRIVRGNLLTDLDALMEEPPDGTTLVVFHTAVLA